MHRKFTATHRQIEVHSQTVDQQSSQIASIGGIHFGKALFNGGSIAQMGAGLDHEIRLDLEIGPITIYIYIYFIAEYETLETNVENELII